MEIIEVLDKEIGGSIKIPSSSLDEETFEVHTALLAETLNPNSSCPVVIISGMGGCGKTTIAESIYHSAAVDKDFLVKIWVSASEDSRISVIFRLIQESLQEKARENEELQEMDYGGHFEGYIQEFLRRFRILVVIDNLWQVDGWHIMKKILGINKNGSKFIITTRRKDVAIQANVFTHYELPCWNMEESWNLLCKKALSGKKVFSPDKEILAKEMLQICSGLPLAIVVLADLLSKVETLKAWYKLKKEIWRQLKLESRDIVELLSLNYSYLADKVQRCFLYMAMFPEGVQIDVEKLQRLWIAEGFATNKDDAEKLFHELVNWNLIQVTGTLWEKYATCRLHGLLRDLAIDKAEKVEFFSIVDTFSFDSVSIPEKRQAIHGSMQNYVSISDKKTSITTLLFFKSHREHFTEIELLSKKCMSYRKLEVLDLIGINLGSNNKILHVILGQVRHLKFLGLANTMVRELPSTIRKLKMLQTLEAGGKYKCRFPKEISSLKHLTNLVGRFEGLLPIEGLNKLHTVKVVDSDQLNAIKSCKNIKELAVCSKTNDVCLDFGNFERVETLTVISSHDSLPQLQSLEDCCQLKRLWLHGLLNKTPKWDDFSSSLKSLILSKSRLTHDPMESLEKLPCLSNLEMKNSYIGNKIVCRRNSFLQLEVLRLCELYELDEWVVEEGAMPKLRGLGIFECHKLKKPERLTKIPQIPESKADYNLEKMIIG